ncbi:toll/interleukin-1 receptor domain-containing protein [Flagellimonas sp. 2504JD4-2]
MVERDWNILVNNILGGKCILVIGPDMALLNKGGVTKPITAHFSNHLFNEVNENAEGSKADDLEEATEAFLKKQPPDALQYEASNFFNNNHDERPVFDNLAHIPFKLIINASPDKSLIKAFEDMDKERGKDYYVDYYDHRSGKRDHAAWDNEEKPLIFYLYGSPDEWDSVVVSEMHLLDYLLSIISGTPALQANISSRFCDDKTSFVFLGFGFHNWYLRILLYTLLGGKEIRKGNTRSRSVALEEMMKGDKAAAEHDRISFFFKNKLSIIYPEYGLEEFIRELKERCVGLQDAKSGKNEIKHQDEGEDHETIGAPSVFICHASEDKDKAKEIYKRLKKEKLNPWIDKEGIRGGDQWNDVLETTIKDIDYFVIVQSTALVGKSRGYVNKEINLALRLSEEVRTGFSYIFPVYIDDSEHLKQLSKYQYTDLTDLGNIKNLAKHIRRDWERLNK